MGKQGEHGISWTHYTFNPWIGCTKVSPACQNCYAERLASTRMQLQVWGKDAPRKFQSDSYWHQPFAWNRAAERAGDRRRVFCGSMCDVMEDRRGVDTARADLWKLIESTPWLDWLLLTKHPQNLRKFLPAAWLEEPRRNVWLGATVESADYLWRLEEVLTVPAPVHWISVEPMLGPLDLRRYLFHPDCDEHEGRCPALESGWFLKLVIAGGESGAKARPSAPQWFRDLRDQCIATGVPFFFKQWGEWAPANMSQQVHQHLTFVLPDGNTDAFDWETPGRAKMDRVGKKAAGRLLDGKLWDEVPIVDWQRGLHD